MECLFLTGRREKFEPKGVLKALHAIGKLPLHFERFMFLCLFYVLMWSKLLAECLRPVCLVLFVCASPLSGLPSPAYTVLITVLADQSA